MAVSCSSTGFLVDEGLIPNTKFLEGWDYQKDEEGLIIANEDMQMLDSKGEPIPGLFRRRRHHIRRAEPHCNGVRPRNRRLVCRHQTPCADGTFPD